MLERHISSRTDNWAISSGHLSGKLWSLSSLALTTGMASLIGMLVNSEETSYETKLVVEGKELIRKRQKLIRIADKSADGWRVVDEYVSDELASGSEDEKRLKKSKDAANRKRRQAAQGRHGPEKRTKTSLSSTDQQLFRGEPMYSIIFMHPCVCFLRYWFVSAVSTS